MVIINHCHKWLFFAAQERPWLYKPGVQHLLLLLGQGWSSLVVQGWEVSPAFTACFCPTCSVNEQHSPWVSTRLIKPADKCRGFEREGHRWPGRGRSRSRQGGVVPSSDLLHCPALSWAICWQSTQTGQWLSNEGKYSLGNSSFGGPGRSVEIVPGPVRTE